MAVRKVKRNLMDNIKDHKDGTYWVQVSRYFGGKNHTRQRYGLMTKGEARRIRDELDEELYQLAVKNASDLPTWADALEEYLAYCEKSQASSTFYSKSKILKADTKGWLDLTIDSILPEMIENRISEATIGKSTDSKINLLKYINGVFKHFLMKGTLSINPCSRVHKIKKPKYKKLEAMTKEEVKTLLQAAKEMNHPWYSIYYVMYQLGLRSGEGLALTWSDINFDGKRAIGPILLLSEKMS